MKEDSTSHTFPPATGLSRETCLILYWSHQLSIYLKRRRRRTATGLRMDRQSKVTRLSNLATGGCSTLLDWLGVLSLVMGERWNLYVSAISV